MDLICVYDSNLEAAHYIQRSLHTFEAQLYKAYLRMESAGIVFTGHKRVQAINLWLGYWWSDEGKANLRNMRLTSQPLA